jgi:SurA N-terminal domain
VRGQRLCLILLLGALAGALAFSGCGSGSESTSAGKDAASSTAAPPREERVSPPSGPIPPGKTLATIAAAPKGAGVISGAEFDQGMTEAASLRSLTKIPKPGDEEYAGMRDEVLGGLIIYVWLEGEAEEMGIDPTDQEVAGKLRKSGEEGSLRQSEYTQATMMERTKNSLLVEKIEDALAKQSPKNPQKAYAEFDTRFQEKWHARTHCVKGFIVQQCGNDRAS